ncbi:MAG: penicillin-binding transpeptidase domain-containing protein [bacterium]|nr:penicillin-binding transpeptidase domain-containing protein [bacterium]
MSISRGRFFILKLITLGMLCAIGVKLFSLQIIEGKSYKDIADNRITTSITEKAPRGAIYDRYGVPLITNKVGYSIVMQRAGMDSAELNSVFEKTTALIERNGCEYYDTLPISYPPYEYTFEDENGDDSAEDEKNAWFDENPYKNKGIESDMSAEAVMQKLKEIYKLDNSYNENQSRRVIGARFEAELRGFSSVTPYTLAENVNVEIVTRIKESKDEYKGVSITNSYVRNFDKPGVATQLLGRIGRINAEEYAEKKNEGYGMNDMIGKQGIELWGESYLRGTDGSLGSLKNVSGDSSAIENVEPIPGNYLVLTIDSELQEHTEKSLENAVNSISASGMKNKGADCDAGAAVCIDVKTGDLLACASYPSYDMSRFDEDYSKLIKDERKPMWNRAVSGTYSPGSTFKPLSAIAALQSNNVTVDEIIVDEGVYRYYPDYQPACWIWNGYHTTHGPVNVSQALENSCNYFFYEVGRRMGIDTLGEYAAKFGLGQKTGVELYEETAGHMASPEYKKQVVETITDSSWFDGDTLQAAIGQSYSLFTPIQLANYTATIANGGTRHKVNLVKSIRSSVDGSIVKEFTPQTIEQINVGDKILNAVKEGMRKVTDEGSASNIFQGYSIAVGGKTGTAQIGSGSDNALFIAYAPFDNPQIAVAVVLEHGSAGTNAAYVARDIFDKYFEKEIAGIQAQQTQEAQETQPNTEG